MMKELLFSVVVIFCGMGASACINGSNSAACGVPDEDCGLCYTGDVTCSYGDISVTKESCYQCQAKNELYLVLCEMGNPASVQEIEEGIVCVDSSSP